MRSTSLALTSLVLGVSARPNPGQYNQLPVSSEAVCEGTRYINRGLVAYGFVPSDARDKVGDTLGGFGSAAAPDVASFGRGSDGSVHGTLYATPDRGWNTEGTIDYQSRIQKFELTFKPTFGSIKNGSTNLDLDLEETILLYKGRIPTTGLDAGAIIPAGDGFPDIPAAVRSDGEVSPAMDVEGLVRLKDGSFWISDEYGPYVYHFTEQGQMDVAIVPPIAFIPFTSGVKTFLSGNPPIGSGVAAAPDPDTGRANNNGFEGLAISPDERYLTVQLQSALMEDGGDHSTRNNFTRQLTYDISNSHSPRLVSEYVVDLPALNDPTQSKNPRATGASELHWLAQNQFLILARDSGHGRGSGDDNSSIYRHIDIVSTRGARDFQLQEVSAPGAVAISPNGYPLPGIQTEEYCQFIDFNNNTDLARFGLHNGGPFAGELNEKWESIAIVPVPEGVEGYGRQEFYVISISDNDFITQNGYYDFGKTQYADASGQNVSSQVLVWQVNLPDYTTSSWF